MCQCQGFREVSVSVRTSTRRSRVMGRYDTVLAQSKSVGVSHGTCQWIVIAVINWFPSVDGATHPGSVAKKLVMNVLQRAHVHIPTLRRENLTLRDDQKDPDLIEDWEESVSALFEWIGMAALGSQRYGHFFLYYNSLPSN